MVNPKTKNTGPDLAPLTDQRRSLLPTMIIGLTALIGLFLISRHSYLLYHSLAEAFAVVIGCGIFMVSWNSRRFAEGGFFIVIGVAYLFVAGLDLLHTLAYQGMGVFPYIGANHSTQLWLAARYLQSLSLLAGFVFIGRRARPLPTLVIFSLVGGLLAGSIFIWPVFPDCFVKGQGLTWFKVGSEYVISGLLATSVWLFYRFRAHFSTRVRRLMIWSVGLTIASELSFTLYDSVYGLTNLIGHYLKIVAFYLVYKAIIETGLLTPFELLFRSLKLSESRFQAFMNNSPLVAFMKDVQGRYLYVNQPFCRMVNRIETEVLGLTAEELFEAGAAREHNRFDAAVMASSRRAEYTIDYQGRTGERSWVIHKFPLTASDGQRILGGVGLDVTERHRAEADLRRALAEKEVLLREVHHRVKNNMQVVYSLLGLQALHETDARVLAALRESQNRIRSMGLMHEILYRDDSLTSPDLSAYVGRLVEELQQAYGVDRERIEINVDFQGFGLDIDRAVACGLILNELISNAIKHAFPQGRSGRITVEGRSESGDKNVMVVADNGIGLPAEVAWDQAESFGLSIVRDLVEKRLKGALTWRTDQGARFVITFPG